VVRLPEREVEHEALGRLWARARVHRLERELHRGEREDVVERITELALRHRLMTRYTSLVAVDSEVVNPEGGAVPVEVPVELPQDVPITALGNQQVVSGVGYAPAARSSDSTRRRALAELQARSGVGAKRMPPVEERPATGTGEDAESATAGAVAFETLRLIESDGSELLVEADGEVWMIDGRRRSLVTVLRADTLSELRRTLHASTPASWSAAPGGGARLVLVTGDGRYSASVRGGGETVEALANLVRSFSR
jgi:hypothetical protein